MGHPTTRQQARNLVVAIAERDDKVDVVEKFINLTIAAAKRDLAEKVLAVIPEVGVTWDNDGYESWMGAPDYKDSVVAAIKQVFADSGIELTTTQQHDKRTSV